MNRGDFTMASSLLKQAADVNVNLFLEGKMKRNFAIPVFTLLVLMIATSAVIAQPQYAYEISTERNSIVISSEEISLTDGEIIAVPGAPAIGYKIVKLALPENTRISGYTVETANPQTIWSGNLDFFTGDIKTGNYPQEIADQPDPAIYGSDEEYPNQRVQILDSGNWGGISLVDLAVYPVSYKPLSQIALYYPQITVHFQLQAAYPQNGLVPHGDKYAYETLSNMVANRNDLPVLASPAGGGIRMALGNMPAPEYIIITSAQIAPGFYPLLQWKNQKGLPTDMVFIEDILATSPGEDEPEQLRNYLIGAYNEGVRFVLLGGDEDVVPIRYLYPGNVNGRIPELRNQQLSDLYYADLTGVWDVDNDGVYGESYNDEPDIYPELYVGRVPARTAADAEIWSNKAVKYELNPGNGNIDYLSKALFICADQMRDMNQHVVLASLLPSYFTYDNQRLVEEPSGSDPNPTQPLGQTVIDVMQEGWGLISNLNHGDFSWYSSKAPGYNAGNWSGVWGDTIIWSGSGTLKDLNTVDQPTVHYSISCDLAAYDFDKGVFYPPPYISTYSFMESFLFQPGSGVAFLGNTRWGWVSASYNLHKKFMTRVFADSTSRLSVAEALSKIDYPGHKDIAYGHTLFGDPEMSLWHEVAGFLDINVIQSNLSTAGYSDFLVTCAGQPVSNAKVALYLPGDIFATALTDEAGYAHFSVVAENDGYMTVTATKQNYIPDQEIIVVGHPLSIDDDGSALPTTPTLSQNYPNPFNPTTTIEFSIARQDNVNLKIFDIAGRLVKQLVSGVYLPGEYSVTWNGNTIDREKVSSGIYYYKLTTGKKDIVRQMTLLK